jgi:hypothetical protein
LTPRAAKANKQKTKTKQKNSTKQSLLSCHIPLVWGQGKLGDKGQFEKE